ncbi:hypothetical protein [Niveispirillum fermenti]|uniref:hypothetical protein n=1 Tax=Niveispirillum fermenti TaxID=1233113 RepID=UPI003A86E3FC
MSCLTEDFDSSTLAAAEEGGPETALAIRRCLESLVQEAKRGQMEDLAEFLALAVLAADDAARARRKRLMRAAPPEMGDLARRKVAGTC